MDWTKQHAVVTGACGFIGSHLVEALVKRGTRVRALTFYDARGGEGWMEQVAPDIRDSVEVVAGDVRDAGQMMDLVQPGDVVFHLAALIGIPYSYAAPRSYVETNINGTMNLLEAARRREAARLLVVSTSEVYGTAQFVPITEEHPLQGQSPYSASKIGAEKLAESYAKSFELPVTVVRPFNTFGPRQSPRAVIATILMQLMHGVKELMLGDPSTTRDFNYVADTAEGMIRLAACPEACGRAVNIGTGTEVSIQQVVEQAQAVTGCSVAIRQDPARIRPAASEVRRLCADNQLLKELTGWTPPSRLEEGLRHTAEWMKEQAGRYDPQRYYI